MSASVSDFVKGLNPVDLSLFNFNVKIYTEKFHYTEEEAQRKAIEAVLNAWKIDREMKAIGFTY